MNDPAPSHGKLGRSRLRAAKVGGQTALKNLSAKIPRNPLISQDLDERIQGNPRKSNPENREIRCERAPAKKTQIYRACSQPPSSLSRQ
jgi:hypothetical protein